MPMLCILGPLTETEVMVTGRTEDRYTGILSPFQMAIENRVVILSIDDISGENNSRTGIA